MICPRDKTECVCNPLLPVCKPLNNHQPKTDLGKKLIDLRAKAVADGMPLEPPKPTMAEIERLVMAVRQSSFDKGELVGGNADIVDVINAKIVDDESSAALLAAIRAYGEG